MDSILILRSSVLGDFIISTPAIYLIRRLNPNAQISLLSIQSAHKKNKKIAKIYEGKTEQPWLGLLRDGIVDKFILMESVNLCYLFRKLRPEIKRIKPDKCYILTDPLVSFKGNLTKLMMLRFIGVKCKIFGWKDYIISNKEKKKKYKNRCINHTLSCFESVFEDNSITIDDYTVEFPIETSEAGMNFAERYWTENRLAGKKVIVISPGGLKNHKIWPVENYIRVINHLLNNDEVDIILTGTKKDLEIGELITNRINTDRIHNLINKTDLFSLAAILKKAYLLIGNDGGTMHLGDAVGCTVVAIMPGLELPGSVEPWHNINNAVRASTDCCPCYSFSSCPYATNKCMKLVSVESVIDRCDNAFSDRKAYNKINISIIRNGKIPQIIVKES